jgi:hypothetical protein
VNTTSGVDAVAVLSVDKSGFPSNTRTTPSDTDAELVEGMRQVNVKFTEPRAKVGPSNRGRDALVGGVTEVQPVVFCVVSQYSDLLKGLNSFDA